MGPDNGLLYPAASKDRIKEVRVLHSDYDGVSKTFHGRDVFSKAVAWLDAGEPFKSLGEKSSLKSELFFHRKGSEGEVTRVDNFGNIVTNIPPSGKISYLVSSKNFSKNLNFYETYSDAEDKTPFVIVGSCNTMEISVKNGSAISLLKISQGDKIKME